MKFKRIVLRLINFHIVKLFQSIIKLLYYDQYYYD